MKSIRYPLIAAIAVFVILLGFGSVYDLQIAQGIYSTGGFARGFGMVMAAFSMYLGYAIYAIFAGAMFHSALKLEWKKWIKVVLIILSVLSYAASVYFSGKEPFSVNGYNNKSLAWLGYVIGVVVNFGFSVGGWFISKKINDKVLVKVILIVLACIVFSMLAGLQGLKAIFHRPRFRYLVNEELMGFTPWWKATSNYKELLERFSAEHAYITKEEFKSFPSGHAGVSCTIMMLAAFLPLFGKNVAKWQLPAFIFGFIWSLLVCLSRMIVGAHYLSDVSMGCIINLLCFFVGNESMIRSKKIQPELEALANR